MHLLLKFKAGLLYEVCKLLIVMLIDCKIYSKHLNIKRIQLLLTWFKIPIKLIPIILKWLIPMIGYNKLAFTKYFLKRIMQISIFRILFAFYYFLKNI